jgi:hypothetical protein
LYRNQKLLEIVREFECVLCSAEDGTVVAAHSNQLRDGKGKGIKAHDYRIAALCYRCHMAIDQGHRMNKQEKEAMWEEAHRKTIGLLFERGKVWVR